MSHPCRLLSFSPILFPATSPEHVLFGPSLLDCSLVSMSAVTSLPRAGSYSRLNPAGLSLLPPFFPQPQPNLVFPKLHRPRSSIIPLDMWALTSPPTSPTLFCCLCFLKTKLELGPWPSSSSPCPHLTTVTAHVTLCYQCLMDGSFPGDWAA